MLSAPLALLGLLSAAPPARLAVEEQLRAQCRTRAADPKNPWALAHGITLEGRGFTASDGRLAADVIMRDFLRRDASSPSPAYAFEPFTADGTPVEPHPALQVKTLVLAGFPLSHTFRLEGGPVELGVLVKEVQRGFRPAAVASPDAAWALDALAHLHSPGATFRNGAGETVRFDAVMDAALAALEGAHAELAAGMKAGQPEVPKRKQGIYAHPCGGMHYIQAVLGWARHPSVREAWGKRLDAQVDILFYRLDSERRQYEAALASAPAQYRLQLLVQMLKFYGHLLETLGRYRAETGWRPSPAQAAGVARARGLLEETVRRLEAVRAFQSLAALKARQRQLSLDLIGDACHAAHGLSYWRK